MAKVSPQSRKRSPRIDAKANKQDGHPDSKLIKQEKAKKQDTNDQSSGRLCVSQGSTIRR